MDDHDAYLVARTRLITSERSLRCDTAYLRNASKDELHAEGIIRTIRAEEAQSIWSVEHEGIPNTFPGMEFLSGMYILVIFEREEKLNSQQQRSWS